MRSSSCGPRIIYSESASLSPCITRSGFPVAAHVCLVSAWNPRDTPRREINFPILPKRSRWSGGSRMPENRDGVTVHRTSNWKREDYYMVSIGEIHYDTARYVNRSRCVKEFEDYKIEEEKHKGQYESDANGNSVEKVINIVHYLCYRISGIFRIIFYLWLFRQMQNWFLFFSLFFFFEMSRYEKLKCFPKTICREVQLID